MERKNAWQIFVSQRHQVLEVCNTIRKKKCVMKKFKEIYIAFDNRNKIIYFWLTTSVINIIFVRGNSCFFFNIFSEWHEDSRRLFLMGWYKLGIRQNKFGYQNARENRGAACAEGVVWAWWSRRLDYCTNYTIPHSTITPPTTIFALIIIITRWQLVTRYMSAHSMSES